MRTPSQLLCISFAIAGAWPASFAFAQETAEIDLAIRSSIQPLFIADFETDAERQASSRFENGRLTLESQAAVETVFGEESITGIFEAEATLSREFDAGNLSLRGSLTHQMSDSDNDKETELDLELNHQHQLTNNLTAELSGSLGYSWEEPSTDTRSIGVSAALIRDNGLSRYELRGSVDRIDEDSATDTRTDRYGVAFNAVLRPEELVSPTGSAEYQRLDADIESGADGDGKLLRGSIGFIAGTREKLVLEARAGPARATLSNGRDEATGEWFAQVLWTPKRLTTVRLETVGTLALDTANSGTSGIPVEISYLRTVSGRIEHELNSRSAAYLSSTYAHEYGFLSDTSTESINSALGYRREITPRVTGRAEVRHEWENAPGNADTNDASLSLRMEIRP